MTRHKKKAVRKNYFIKKSFQTKFFAWFALLLIMEALAIGGLFMYISGQTLTTGYQGSQFVIDKTSSFFFVSFVIMSVIVGISVGTAGILVFIFLSHRIAGPLYRFEKAMQDLSEGNFAARVNLRRTDELAGLQNVLNGAFEKIDSQLKSVKTDLEAARKLTLAHDKEGHMQAVKEIIARIKQKIDAFKTS